jgi:hypothetical protein
MCVPVDDDVTAARFGWQPRELWDELGGDERFTRRLHWWRRHRPEFETSLA